MAKTYLWEQAQNPEANANQAALTGTAKAYTTTATTTNLAAAMTAVITLVERIRTDLIAAGIIKGSA